MSALQPIAVSVVESFSVQRVCMCVSVAVCAHVSFERVPFSGWRPKGHHSVAHMSNEQCCQGIGLGRPLSDYRFGGSL